MAHFARIQRGQDDKWIVQEVHVINNNVVGEPGLSFPDTEQLGQAFQQSLGLYGIWKQTSYNGAFRKQYAGIGYEYDEVNDVFIAPRPFSSWSLDENFDWQPPVPRPEDDYLWNEDDQEWQEIPTN
jgi:hypothetical protein